MHYRVYRLNAAGRIVSGDWIEADSDRVARAKADAFWRDGVPALELWQGARRLTVLSRPASLAP